MAGLNQKGAAGRSLGSAETCAQGCLDIMEEDGQANEVEEVAKIEIQDLPVEVLHYLVGFLDYRTRRTCRLVSHFLKGSMDDVGISVKIDDRKPESIEFCKEVNATEVRVQQMLVLDPSLNLNMKKWKTVILTGPIDAGWLNNDLLRNCPNLRLLFLDGSCLTSRDFGDPLLDLPIFQHLTQIHVYSHLYFRDPRNDAQLCGWDEDIQFNTRINQNMVFLLRSLRSRILRVLNVFVSRSRGNLIPPVELREACWENKALFPFIESHRHSLEEVNGAGPNFLINGEPQVYQVPTQLKQFSWDGLQPFWMDVLLAQVSLERLYIKTKAYDRTVIHPLLETVLLNNAPALTVISLHLSEDPNLPLIDMSIFSNLESLQKLTIEVEFEDFLIPITNLNQLPRTRLTHLELRGSIVKDLDGIGFMDGFKPEVLKIEYISTSGLLADRHYMLNFVKVLLRCRSLNDLLFDFFPPNISVEGRVRCWRRSQDLLLTETGLKLWLANLSAQGQMNHYCNLLQINPVLHPDQPLLDFRGDYFRLLSQLWIRGDFQDLPLNLPRNRKSKTRRPDGIERVNVSVFLSREWEKRRFLVSDLRPVNWNDLENGNFARL